MDGQLELGAPENHAWQRYFALTETGRVGIANSPWSSPGRELANLGHPNEIVFVSIEKIARTGDDRDKEVAAALVAHGRRSRRTPSHAPRGARLLGYDVSTPVPSFHSVLREPNLAKRGSELERLVNSNGLCDDVRNAEIVGVGERASVWLVAIRDPERI